MSILIFQGTHENPELIWNDESREKVSETVKKLKNRYMTISDIHICTNCKATEVKIKAYALHKSLMVRLRFAIMLDMQSGDMQI